MDPTQQSKTTQRSHWPDEEKTLIRDLYGRMSTAEDFHREILSQRPGSTLRTAKAYLTFVTKEGLTKNPALHTALLKLAGDEQRAAKAAQVVVTLNVPTGSTPASLASTVTNALPASNATGMSWVDGVDTGEPPTPQPYKSNFGPKTLDPSLVKTLDHPTATAFNAEDVAATLGVPKSEVSDALTYGRIPKVTFAGREFTTRDTLEQLKKAMGSGMSFRDACHSLTTGAPGSTQDNFIELDGLDPSKVYCPHLRPKGTPCPHCMGVGALSPKVTTTTSVTAPVPTKATEVTTSADLLTGGPPAKGSNNTIEDKIALLTQSYAELREWTHDDVELHIRQVKNGMWETWLSGMGDQDSASFFPSEDTEAPTLEESLDKVSQALIREYERRFSPIQRLKALSSKR